MRKRRIKENWTAYVVSRMHRYDISGIELARECGYTPQYLSMVLNCRKEFENKESKQRTKTAIFNGLKRIVDRIYKGEEEWVR